MTVSAGPNLPIIETAITAWRDAFAAGKKMPTLFGFAIATLIVVNLVRLLLGGGGLLGSLSGLILAAIQALVATPLAIAVHRLVLLGENRDTYSIAFSDQRFQKFFIIAVAVGVVSVIPHLLGGLYGMSVYEAPEKSW
jgi:hypothetical protein